MESIVERFRSELLLARTSAKAGVNVGIGGWCGRLVNGNEVFS